MDKQFKKLREIQDLMTNGNWTDASKKYKQLMIVSPAKFTQYLDYLKYDFDNDLILEIVKDFALLGFYTREMLPNEP
jgi:hypothetical protein